MDPIEQYSIVQPLVKIDIDKAIKDYASQSQFGLYDIPTHQHTGIDANRVEFSDIADKFFFLPYMIPNSDQATSYGVVFIAPFTCHLISVQESHLIAGTISGTLQVVKQTPGQGIGAGTNMLNSAISLTSTANSPVIGTLSTDYTALTLNPGDRIKLTVSGTLTTLAGVCVTLTLSY